MEPPNDGNEVLLQGKLFDIVDAARGNATMVHDDKIELAAQNTAVCVDLVDGDLDTTLDGVARLLHFPRHRCVKADKDLRPCHV